MIMSDSAVNEMNIHVIPTPLVYPSPTEGQTQYDNVLLICSEVQDYQTFVDSVNSSTFPIVYSVTSSKTELIGLLRSKFTSISRLCLIFNYSGEDVKMFLDMEPLFSNDSSIINRNTQFIIDIIKEFQVKNIDYLACSTLNYLNWVNYYETLTQNTNVIVGASDDRTGNIKYGGDWLLETINEDIETIYFKQNIQYYKYLLDTVNVVVGQLSYACDTVSKTASVSIVNDYRYIITNAIVNSNVNDLSGNSYSVTSLGVNAFYYTIMLTSITIPSSVKIIADGAFNTSAIRSITIPNSVTYLGHYVFHNSFNLTSVTLPDSITTIGTGIFFSCSNLVNVILPKNVNMSNSFNVFNGCTSLKRVVIPQNVTIINANIFQSCSSLTTLIFPASLIIIGGTGMFAGCTSLTSVYIPDVNGLNMTSPSNGPIYFYNSYVQINAGRPVNLLIPLTAKQNYDSGVTVSELVNEFRFTILEMYDNGNGISIANLIAGGITILQLYNGGITVSQLYNAGITILQLYNGGITVSQLIGGGLTIIELYNAGITILQLYNGGITVQQLYDAGIPKDEIITSNICFPAGTPVFTNQGIIPIELLDPEVHTIRDKKIVGITQTITPDKYLVCFDKDSLSPNIPSQNTIISKNHEIFYKEKMIKAKDFIGKFENVKKIKYTGEVLYNILMEKHDKMMVNNLICETLNPENTVAQLYKILQTLTPEKQRNVIKQYNEHITKEKTYSSKKINK